MPISRSQMNRQLRMGGGIMNIQPRQQYGLGSIVKSIGKGVKKAVSGVKDFAKSDLGKAAIMAGIGFGIPGTSMGGLFGRASFGGAATGMFGQAGIGATFGAAKTALGSKFASMGQAAKLKGLGIGNPTTKGSLGKTLGVFAGGSALGALMGAAEEGDQEAVAATRDVGALKGYLASYYSNLGYSADQIATNVERDTAEYTSGSGGYAVGGRVGYSLGDLVKTSSMFQPVSASMSSGDAPSMPSSGMGGMLSKLINNNPQLFKNVSSKKSNNFIDENFNGIDDRQEVAYGGRIGLKDGTDFENYLKGRKQFEKEQGKEQLYREYKEDMRRQKIAEQRSMVAMGGRMKLAESLDPKIREIVIDLMDNEGFEFGEAVKEAYRRVESTENKANGGRMGYAYGSNDLVDQASGIMNLPKRVNNAGVKELDLRDSGGFIPPVGVKEKADDIPAMLSNNEFVFTADSVREFGDGDVNKGAQRMYDMMKKLEKGGRV